jgi:hypothetical protein
MLKIAESAEMSQATGGDSKSGSAMSLGADLFAGHLDESAGVKN